MERPKDEFYWIKTNWEATRWPLEVRSIGDYSDPTPFVDDRPRGAGFHIISWTVAGAGELKVGQKTREIKPNDILIIPAGTCFSYYTVSKTVNWKRWWFTVTGDQSAAFLKGLNLDRVIIKPLGRPPALLFNRLFRTLPRRGLTGDMDRLHLAVRLLYEINARLKWGFQGESKDRFAKIAEWAQNNFDPRLDANALARRAGLSRSHFSRGFTRALGLSPKQFILETKIDTAKNLLANTRLGIKEIAEKSGWYDGAHFCRQFQNATGFTPTAFRTQVQV